MEYQRLAGAVALMSELPRFTPAQWQKLFWHAGLTGSTVHLFLRDSVPNSPWTMVLDTGRGIIDLEAFSASLSPGSLDVANASDEQIRAASAHRARIELLALKDRCPGPAAPELVARAAAGLLKTTYSLGWFQAAAGILLPPERCADRIRELPQGEFPLDLYISIRQTRSGPLVVVDTLGIPDFDLPDLEIQVDPELVLEAWDLLASLARELVGRRRTLTEGEALRGPLGLEWRVGLANASVPPFRAVMRFELG